VSSCQRVETGLARTAPSRATERHVEALRQNAELLNKLKLICPVQPHLQKDSAFPVGQINSIALPVSSHRGAARDRHGRGAGCGGRGGAIDEQHQSGRRSRVVLTPRRWRQVGGGNSAGDGDKKARSPGSTKETVKTIARGMPGFSGVTVVTILVCFLHFAHEAAGALGARHSLRPLFFWANGFVQTSGASRRGNAKPCLRLLGCLKLESVCAGSDPRPRCKNHSCHART
jgi:hypothetical protein